MVMVTGDRIGSAPKGPTAAERERARTLAIIDQEIEQWSAHAMARNALYMVRDEICRKAVEGNEPPKAASWL